MKKLKFIFITLLIFNSQYSFAQNKKIDSILALLSHSKDTTKVNQFLLLSDLCYYTSEDSAMLYANQALLSSTQIRYNTGIGRSYWQIAEIHMLYGSPLDSAVYYYQLAKNIFQDAHDSLRLAKVYQSISFILTGPGYFTQGLSYLDSASIIYSIKKDTGAYIVTLIRKIEISSYFKRYDEVRAFITEINLLDNKFRLGDESLAQVYGVIGLFYSDIEKYDSAIDYLKKSIEIIERTNNLRTVSFAYGRLGLTYSKKGEWAKAITYVQKGLKMAQMNDFIKERGDNLNALYSIYKARGDNKTALWYYEQYNEFNDSINASLHQHSLDRVNLELTNVKNIERIELLKKDNELQQTEVARQKVIRNGTVGGLAVVLSFAVVFFFQRRRITKEKKRSDDLLLNILPAETAEELKKTGSTVAKSFDEVTVMFTDFKNFTQASEHMSAEELVAEINYCYSAFDNIVTKHNIEKIKTIGDSYMCAGGLPVENKTNACDIINAALEIQKFMEQYKKEKQKENNSSFEIRIGIHTGPVVAGIVGIKKFAYDIWGDTVNIASRMESSGEAGKVNISEVTYQLVKEKFTCTYRGKIEAKNKGQIDMYFVNYIMD